MPTFSKFAPIRKSGLPDYPKQDERWEDWLAEQQHYFENGYEVGSERITGHYYFLLNFGTVEKLSATGDLLQSPAYHIDSIREMFDAFEYVTKKGKNLFVWKARDKMFSFSTSAYCAAEMTFATNATILTAFPKGGEVRYKENFRAKFDGHMNNVPSAMMVYPDIEKNQSFLHYGFIEKDENGNDKIFGSNNKIAFMEISKKDVAKSFRSKKIFIDETGEVDILKPFIETSGANLMYGGQKFGSIIMGGTSNMISKGYNDVCYIWENAQALGFEKIFIPRYKALLGWVPQWDENRKPLPNAEAIDWDTGESLIHIAENNFTEIEKVFEDTGNAEGLLEFKQNYPKTEADAFMRAGASVFPVEELKAQKGIISTNSEIKSAITRGNIEYVPNSNPLQTRFVPNPYGYWQVYSHPDPTLPLGDVIGIDTVKDDADVVDTDSKNAIVVYRPFQSMDKLSGLPVCIYHHRPSSIYTFFQHAMLTSIHYNAPTLVEYINQMIFDYYIENGNGRFLAVRPSLLTELGSKAQNKWGVKPQSGKPVAISYAVEETRNNAHNHPFVELIDELIAFGSKNTDIASAYLWAILLAKERVRVQKSANAAAAKKKPRKVTKLVKINGILQVKES